MALTAVHADSLTSYEAALCSCFLVTENIINISNISNISDISDTKKNTPNITISKDLGRESIRIHIYTHTSTYKSTPPPHQLYQSWVWNDT